MYKELNEQNREWLDGVWAKIDAKLSQAAIKHRGIIPYTSEKGIYKERPNNINWWTNGFWGSMMLLMYKETENEEYLKTAEYSEVLLDEALDYYDRLDHDVGFMWHILSGAKYRLIGDKRSLNRALRAASSLSARYNVDGGFIPAWNGKNVSGWTIIDCLMNLPLLYWASETLGMDSFRRVAIKHADMALRDHIRPDGSVNHIVEHDTDTGEVIRITESQGYSPDSCWTRGLAWAVYGMALSYRYTKEQRYLDAALKTADYFAEHVAKSGYKTPIDFSAPDTPQYYDSTAGVCAACGLLEISEYVDESKAQKYVAEAIKILKATDQYFCNYDVDYDSIVQMGSERYPNRPEWMAGVHIPIIYGDFFYVESVLKLRNQDFSVW